jgi:type IV pilus assembly protein PilA
MIQMSMKAKAQQGFTLIELMIVVAIVGILAAIALPAYQDYIARSQMSEALELTSGLKTNVAEVFADDATCPQNATAATKGISISTDIVGKYVSKVTTAGTAAAGGGCTIAATMKATGVSKSLQSATLTLTMSNADKGSIVWGCTSSVADKYLPSACRTGS